MRNIFKELLIVDLSETDKNIIKEFQIPNEPEKLYIRKTDFIRFHNLINLKHLEALYWDYETYNIPDGLFESFKNLKVLKFVGLKINIFKQGIFSGLDNLNALYIDSCNLGIIENTVFYDIINLKTLSLRCNNIFQLFENNFQSLKNLELLALDSNKIKTTTHLNFFGLENLICLSLLSNVDITIEDNSFRTLKHLKYLDLSFNQLEYLSPGIFTLNVNLMYLKLRENKFRSLEFIDCLTELEFLDVCNNELSMNEFNRISNKNLKFLAISCKEIDKLSINLEQLIALKIEKVQRIEQRCFEHLLNLTQLEIRGSSHKIIQKLDSEHFYGVNNLEFFKFCSYENVSILFDDIKNKKELLLKAFKKLDKKICEKYSHEERHLEILMKYQVIF